jgi:hypothetical protein
LLDLRSVLHAISDHYSQHRFLSHFPCPLYLIGHN